MHSGARVQDVYLCPSVQSYFHLKPALSSRREKSFCFSIQRTQWLACSNPARHLWAHHSPPVLCSCSTAPRMELSQLPFWPWDPHYPNRSHLTAGQWCLIAKYQLQRNKGKQCEIESKPTNLMLSMGSSVHLTAEHTQRFPENHSIFWVGREL